jgi:protein-disulfide isomerase
MSTHAAPALPDDMALGNPKAPVTVIEYASVGCPHCGAWARDVFPAFKAKYVDTGQVRYVLREMLYGDAPLAMMGFLTARCAGSPKYFQVVDAIFAAQPEMERAGDVLPSLTAIARQAGLTQAQFVDCLSNQDAQRAVQARSDVYNSRDHITGTPTFVVGDETLGGDQTLDQLGAAIAKAAHGRPR